MITARYQRGVRNLGGFAGGTSRLARPPAVLEPPDLRPDDPSPTSGVYSIAIAPGTSSVGDEDFNYHEWDFTDPETGAYADRLHLSSVANRVQIEADIRITRVELTITLTSAVANWEIGVALTDSITTSVNDAIPAVRTWEQEATFAATDTLALDETLTPGEEFGPGVGYILVDTYSFFDPTRDLTVESGLLTVTWETI